MTDTQPPAPGLTGQQPSAKWCFVCGVENPFGLKIRFFNDGYQRVVARVTLDDAYQSYPGIAHGGILATILDEAMGRAVLISDTNVESVADERFMYTVKMDVRYRRPVPLHEEFMVRGWVEKDMDRKAAVAGEIVLPDGTVAVEGSGILVEIPPEHIASMVDKDVGWRVYP